MFEINIIFKSGERIIFDLNQIEFSRFMEKINKTDGVFILNLFGKERKTFMVDTREIAFLATYEVDDNPDD